MHHASVFTVNNSAIKHIKIMSKLHEEKVTPIWADAKTIGKLYGITRTPLYRLMATGRIKTTSLLDDGASRGKRLFCTKSLESYLESKASGGM